MSHYDNLWYVVANIGTAIIACLVKALTPKAQGPAIGPRM